jgi:23S rRNA pseudouridine1911/1915/1917 synthase
METHRFDVGPDHAGQRLDQALAALTPDLTRSRAGQIIKDGLVQLDGRPGKPAAILRAGQVITATIPPRPTMDLAPQALPLRIVFEDEHLIVIDKAAGMVVHPAAGNPDGTLVNALLHHAPAMADLAGDERPGIVHRLDKGTSGLLVVAKTGLALQGLQRQFAGREVAKTYLAIVLGRPAKSAGRIEMAIGRHVRDRKKISSVTAKGRPAITAWRIEASCGDVTALACDLLTGRTHQIRVHCAESGWPLAGDETYGGVRPIRDLRDPELRAACAALERPALHARRLAFRHPATAAWLEFASPPPADLQRILALLEMKNG